MDGEQIRLAGSDVNHMKNVLRMKPGEEVWVSDGEGMDYFCSVEGYEEKEAVLRVVKKKVSQTELASRLILFQGLPKGDKMEWIVQKAVELGAYRIVPFAAKRSVVKLDQKKAGKRRENAGRQSPRGCGTIEERNCATSAGCDELSGSDELRERAGCSACSL